MKRILSLILVVLIVGVASGCYTTGLSTRERGAFNYSNLIYGLYDSEINSAKEIKPVKRPIKLAVAQVGETTPQDLLVEKLETQRHLVSQVVPLPIGGNINNYSYNNQENKDDVGELEKKMGKMRRLAKDLGADYIFLVGGSADYGTTANWLSFFDITIIGGFILPSNKISVDARASGALIEVESGRVIFMVNSETKLEEHVPTYTSMGREDIVLGKARDQLITDLADKFVEKLAQL